MAFGITRMAFGITRMAFGKGVPAIFLFASLLVFFIGAQEVCQDEQFCFSGFGAVQSPGNVDILEYNRPFLVPSMNFSCDGTINEVRVALGAFGSGLTPSAVLDIIGIDLQLWSEIQNGMGTSYSLVRSQSLVPGNRAAMTYNLTLDPPMPASSGEFVGFRRHSLSTEFIIFGRTIPATYSRQLQVTSTGSGYTVLRETADPAADPNPLQFYSVDTFSPLISVQFSTTTSCLPVMTITDFSTSSSVALQTSGQAVVPSSVSPSDDFASSSVVYSSPVPELSSSMQFDTQSSNSMVPLEPSSTSLTGSSSMTAQPTSEPISVSPSDNFASSSVVYSSPVPGLLSSMQPSTQLSNVLAPVQPTSTSLSDSSAMTPQPTSSPSASSPDAPSSVLPAVMAAVVLVVVVLAVLAVILVAAFVWRSKKKKEYNFSGPANVGVMATNEMAVQGVHRLVKPWDNYATIIASGYGNYDQVEDHDMKGEQGVVIKPGGEVVFSATEDYVETTFHTVTKNDSANGSFVLPGKKEEEKSDKNRAGLEPVYYSVDGPDTDHYCDLDGLDADRFCVSPVNGSEPGPYETPVATLPHNSALLQPNMIYSVVPTKAERQGGCSSLTRVQVQPDIIYETMETWGDSPFTTPANATEILYSQLAKRGCIEIPRSEIRLKDQLGKGEFGDVLKADWDNKYGTREVAVKLLHAGCTEEDEVKFLQEANIMSQFKHPNIVGFYGAVTIKEPNMIVLELLSNGDLKEWLTKQRESMTVEKSQSYPSKLLQFCKNVAEGALYLSTKQFIHRDLAARNILLDSNLKCKIADFGLARELVDDDVYKTQGKKIPIRWTAPEAIMYKTYTTASDVWSYACVMFEIWSLGLKPCAELTPTQVVDQVVRKRTYIECPPTGCPRMIYELMTRCWQYEPENRPTFKEILKTLKSPSEQLLSVPWEDLWSTTDPRKASVLGKDPLLMKSVYRDLQNRMAK